MKTDNVAQRYLITGWARDGHPVIKYVQSSLKI
jgi:hypothetical protein